MYVEIYIVVYIKSLSSDIGYSIQYKLKSSHIINVLLYVRMHS